MSYPYTSGAIKGFPRNLQRKSETRCEREPPPSPSCCSVPRSERRGGWHGTARKPSRGKHQHLPPEPFPWSRPSPGPSPGSRRWSPAPPAAPFPRAVGCHPPLSQGEIPRSPASLTALNAQRGEMGDLRHRSALQKAWKFCADFAGSLQHLREVKALPFSSPRYT